MTIIVSLTGCFQHKTSLEANKVAFDSIQVDQSYHLLGIDTNPNCNLKLNYIFPSGYSDIKIQAKLENIFNTAYFSEEYINLSPRDAVNKYIAEYIENYKKLETDYLLDVEQSKKTGRSIGSWFGYYELSKNKILYNKQGFISFMVYIEI